MSRLARRQGAQIRLAEQRSAAARKVGDTRDMLMPEFAVPESAMAEAPRPPDLTNRRPPITAVTPDRSGSSY